MDAAGPDVRQTVEYSRDKWTMRKVPQALLLCLIGLVLVIHIAPGLPHPGMLVIFVCVLAVWVLGQIFITVVFDGVTASQRWLAGGLCILATFALGVLAVVARKWNFPGEILGYRGRPHPPANILGWMIVLGAVGWIAVAIYRHLIPARPPMLMLSPAGIAYHGAGIRGLVIPWHEVQGVDGFEVMGASGYPVRNEDMTVVLVTREFHERHILPRRPFMPPPGWDRLFMPKGALVQIPLSHEWFAIEPRHIRLPLEARWKAFRSAPLDAGSASRAQQVYGTWSIDGSLWQALAFLVPLAGIVAVLASAAGAWQR